MARTGTKKANAPKVKKEQPMQNAQVERKVVEAPMPIKCPWCGSTKHTIKNGVHYNLHFKNRFEHRVCTACGYTFTAVRPMTEEEIKEKAKV